MPRLLKKIGDISTASLFFVAALSLTPLSAATVAEAGSFSTTIQLNAVVRAYANMNIVSQRDHLVITNTDVRRGYVELTAAALVEFKSNDPKGFLVTFATPNANLFQKTTVHLMGRDIDLGPEGGWVPLVVIGTTRTTIGYRFVLADGTRAGTYEWPIEISVNPM